MAQLLNLLWTGLNSVNEVKHTFAVQEEEQSGLTEVPQMKGSAHLSDANNQREKIQEMKIYFEHHHDFSCV